MRRIVSIAISGAVLALLTACHQQKPVENEKETVGTSTSIEGDSTLYGLACDGCTDTVLVFLPGKGGDPVTYHILEATKKRRIIGRPMVGDWIAVILNGKDTTVADMVIDLDQLKGTWVELAYPTVKERITEVAFDEEMKAHMDSMVQAMMKPVEMGFALKRHYQAQAVGIRRSSAQMEENSPVVFPEMKHYTKWHVINGKLVLTSQERSLNDSVKHEEVNDTADFLFMTRDSLRLRFKEGEKGFYRKQ
jgi:hypothetical protein